MKGVLTCGDFKRMILLRDTQRVRNARLASKKYFKCDKVNCPLCPKLVVGELLSTHLAIKHCLFPEEIFKIIKGFIT